MKSSTPENSIFLQRSVSLREGSQGIKKEKRKHRLTTLKIEGMLSLSYTFPALCIPFLVRRPILVFPQFGGISISKGYTQFGNFSGMRSRPV